MTERAGWRQMRGDRERDDEFCPHCDIRMSYHSGVGDDIEEWECETAQQKVDLVNRFWGSVLR